MPRLCVEKNMWDVYVYLFFFFCIGNVCCTYHVYTCDRVSESRIFERVNIPSRSLNVKETRPRVQKIFEKLRALRGERSAWGGLSQVSDKGERRLGRFRISGENHKYNIIYVPSWFSVGRMVVWSPVSTCHAGLFLRRTLVERQLKIIHYYASPLLLVPNKKKKKIACSIRFLKQFFVQ